MAGDSKLKELRDRIRATDDEIFRLVAARQALAKEVGGVKLVENLPIKDYKVEKEVLERSLKRAQELGVYGEFAEQLTRLLIKFSVAAQDEFHKASRRARPGKQRKILVAGGRGHMGRWLSEYFDSFGHQVSHLDQPGAAPTHYPLVTDLRAAAQSSDVIVLSTPISVTAALIDELAATGTKALVFDICSLKTPLLAATERAARQGLRIASAHPMFGPRVELLTGRNILICHVANQEATDETRALFKDTTANLIEMPIAEHDELMGYVLGLSHLTNLAFASTLAHSGLPFAALKGAASTTFNAQLEVAGPVVHENQDLYYEIQSENGCTPALVAAFQQELAFYQAAIANKDREAFKARMDKSRQYLKSEDTP